MTARRRPSPSQECREFKNGRCSRGDSCRFNHVGGPTGEFNERRFDDRDDDRRSERGYDDRDRSEDRGDDRRYDDEDDRDDPPRTYDESQPPVSAEPEPVDGNGAADGGD